MTNIIFIGFVSFFVDISTEMVYPLIPLYLTGVLGSSPALVGIVEGIAESLASLLKVYSGYISDRYKRKKPLAFLGYSTSVIYKIALILSTSWLGILFARVIDRFGKGVRTAPRDLLVYESAKSGKLGNAFGIHKMLDMAGSAIGVLIAYFLMAHSTGQFAYKKTFLISALPAVIGLMVLLFVKETKSFKEHKEMGNFIEGFKKLDLRLKLFLIIAFLFNLGNSSNAFLLLRAQNAGFTAVNIILLYFLYNSVSSFLALPFGSLSDKIGRKKLLVTGYLAFSLVYFGFAIAKKQFTVILLFAIYGIYTALTSGIERALVSEIAPLEFKGTVLGLHSSLVGIALLPASVIAGFLWDIVSPSAPFYFGGTLAFFSAAFISIILRKNTSIENKISPD
ncbi:MAG: MFS transporter [Clostridiales bacterium]|nr:MFS transporter [Clostridiales bacterium]